MAPPVRLTVVTSSMVIIFSAPDPVAWTPAPTKSSVVAIVFKAEPSSLIVTPPPPPPPPPGAP